MRIRLNVFLTSALVVAITMVSAQASSADVIFTAGNHHQANQQNIQFETAQTGTVLEGFTNHTDTLVRFTGTETLKSGVGAARIQSVDLDGFTNLTFTVPTRAFDSLVLDLDATEDGFVTFSATNQFGVTETSSPFALGGSGNNFFTITTDALQVMTSLSFTSSAGIAFVDAAQFRVVTASLTGTPDPVPVPEPASMLLLGTGLAGLASAARRRRNAAR